MWVFVFGLLLGAAAKAIYDLFKEEQLPLDTGLSTGRIEALLDETRQTVRELQSELREALQAGAGRVKETTGKAEEAGEPSETGEPAAAQASKSGGNAGSATSKNAASAGGSGSSPTSTRGTRETMS